MEKYSNFGSKHTNVLECTCKDRRGRTRKATAALEDFIMYENDELQCKDEKVIQDNIKKAEAEKKKREDDEKKKQEDAEKKEAETKVPETVVPETKEAIICHADGAEVDGNPCWFRN